MSATEISIALKAMYDEMGLTTPTMFLQSLFGKNPTERTISQNEKVEIDIIRDQNLIAFDVMRIDSDGNLNKVERYTNKEYSPPLYDEVTALTASMFSKRSPGQSPYAPVDRIANMLRLAARAMQKQTRKIHRAMEKQAKECLFDGVVNLVNTESVDYKRKATHNITPITQWTTVAGDPIGDLAAACQVTYIDGKIKPNTAVFGTTAWSTFIQNTNVKNYLDNRRIEPGLFSPRVAPENATFQGRVWVNDFELDCFTYPDFWEDGAGTATNFVPDKQVCIMNSAARLDKAFAAVELLQAAVDNYNELGVPAFPELIPGEFVPYSYIKWPKSHYVGVQSAPLLIPVAIDTITNVNAVA